MRTGLRLSTEFQSMLRISAIIVILLLSYYAVASAQDYRFQVPEVEFDVNVNKDASATLVYKITFKNDRGAHVIDIVDIGLPTENYDIKNMKAALNGVPRKQIQNSQYVSPGVEVHLGAGIGSGESGVFEFEATIPDLVFSDSTRKDYASFQITPTWFGSQFVQGFSTVMIRVHLPEGLQKDEILYQNLPFTNKTCEADRCTVEWKATYLFTQPRIVGVSFPKRVMDRLVVLTWWDLFKQWYEANHRTIALYCFVFSAVIFVFSMFRAFGGGGCLLSVFGIFAMILLSLFLGIAGYVVPSIASLFIVETLRRKRKKKYLPAIASVEGGGIKRGLTAPEAAILLEKKPEQIVAMVLFGLMKKGFIQQVSKKGEKAAFVIPSELPVDRVLHNYESQVLKLLDKKQKTSPTKQAKIAEISFVGTLKSFGKQVASKLSGFDVDETKQYYKHIVSRAWKEVQEGGINADEIWQQKMDEKVDWLLLDDDFEGRFRPYRDIYIPGAYRSGTGLGVSIPGTPAPRGDSGSTGPRFSDVAGSLAGWMETTSGSLASSLGISGPLHNINLQTGGGSYRGGGGGGGGGCACACAGCACACACAGGGR